MRLVGPEMFLYGFSLNVFHIACYVRLVRCDVEGTSKVMLWGRVALLVDDEDNLQSAWNMPDLGNVLGPGTIRIECSVVCITAQGMLSSGLGKEAGNPS